jgi:hypothetical protein
VKASDPVGDASDAALGEGPADVDAAATGGTVVDVLASQVVVVVVLDGTVVVVEDASVESVELAGSSTCRAIVVDVVLVVLVLVELAVLVEVDEDGLEVEVLVVVLAEQGAVVVVVDGAVVVVVDGAVVVVVDGAVVVLDGAVVVVVVSVANPVGVVVAAEARLPADRVAERTRDPKSNFINRTDQRGIRQSFPPPASAPVRVAPALGSNVCNRDARWYVGADGLNATKR